LTCLSAFLQAFKASAAADNPLPKETRSAYPGACYLHCTDDGYSARHGVGITCTRMLPDWGSSGPHFTTATP